MVKWTQKHFEQENQKEKLVKKAEEIVNTTGCKAFVDTVQHGKGENICPINPMKIYLHKIYQR